jgi:cysteine sulfinate desulfinase/cysteine desulfurase-like protein
MPLSEKMSTATQAVSATAIAAALKTFARTLSQHSERQSDLIDVFATALKELQTEIHRSKMRSQTLQNRLDVAEARIAELEKVVMAMRRQGWVN